MKHNRILICILTIALCLSACSGKSSSTTTIAAGPVDQSVNSDVQTQGTFSETQEKEQIYQKIVSPDFVELMYEHTSAGFVPGLTADELLDSVYGTAFMIPNFEENQGVILDTDIWYVPVIYNDRIVLLNAFFFVGDELQYTISSGYTDIINEAGSGSIRWVFDNGVLKVCSPTDSLYESLPELDPFEKNSVVTQPLREFYVNIEDTGSSTN
ncbi:MAG: hypothetical protein J5636_08330 [Clostridiales bacterium]|nr:hypothetical protein [Clostridiales bacterium]